MREIKDYRPSTNSLCEGQVLSCPHENKKARIIVQEMAESLAYQLCDRGMVTDSLTMDVGYDRENCDNGSYRGAVHIDHYGRKVPKGAHGSIRLDAPTFLERAIAEALGIYETITGKVEMIDAIFRQITMRLAIFDLTVEIIPMPGLGAGDPLIRVNSRKYPIIAAIDQASVIVHLKFKTAGLCLLIC